MIRNAREGAVKIADGVGQGDEEIGRASKETHGVIEGGGGDAYFGGGTCDWQCTIELKAAAVVGISERDGVPVQGSNDISAGCKILPPRQAPWPENKHGHEYTTSQN